MLFNLWDFHDAVELEFEAFDEGAGVDDAADPEAEAFDEGAGEDGAADPAAGLEWADDLGEDGAGDDLDADA